MYLSVSARCRLTLPTDSDVGLPPILPLPLAERGPSVPPGSGRALSVGDAGILRARPPGPDGGRMSPAPASGTSCAHALSREPRRPLLSHARLRRTARRPGATHSGAGPGVTDVSGTQQPCLPRARPPPSQAPALLPVPFVVAPGSSAGQDSEVLGEAGVAVWGP